MIFKSLKWKLALLIAMSLMLSCVGLMFVAYSGLITTANELSVQRAKSDMSFTLKVLDLSYPGEWRVEGDQLYKGDTLINDNNDIVDDIAKLSEGTCTIFLGDTRIATNVKKEDGSRAVGTQAAKEVSEIVLGGQAYQGEADVLGELYEANYSPIKDNTGKVIGMLYIGFSKQSIKDNVSKYAVQLALGCLLGLVIFVLINIYMANKVVAQPVIELTEKLTKVANKDLTVAHMEVKSKDEIGQLANNFNQMKDNLEQVIKGIAQTARDVAETSTELSAQAQQTSSGASETAATMTEFAAGIDQISNNIQEVAKTSSNVNAYAQEGSQQVKVVGEQFSENNRVVASLGQVITNLDQKSKDISQIVGLITQIADQTNLLALNAAIEAARAGDAGRGFAVVAEEVRKLAEQSANSTKQISDIIAGIQQETQRAVNEMNATGVIVNSINQAISELEQGFGQIAEAVAELSSQIQAVAAASEQMSMGVQNVAASTEETTATIEEVTAAAERLTQMASDMEQMTKQFRL